MKSVFKYLYIILFLGTITLSSCSDDDPTQDEPKQEQPEEPNNDGMNESEDISSSNSEFRGTWEINEIGSSFKNIDSYGQAEFEKSDSLKIMWYYENNKYNNPYSIAKGKYTVRGNSLRLEWKNMITDSIVNTAFNTLYLEGEYDTSNYTTYDKPSGSYYVTIREYESIRFRYSTYDISGDVLTGPHEMSFRRLIKQEVKNINDFI